MIWPWWRAPPTEYCTGSLFTVVSLFVRLARPQECEIAALVGAQNLLRVAPLTSIEDYVFIGMVTLVWAAVLGLIWRLVPTKLGK